jgi:hypothetical protein
MRACEALPRLLVSGGVSLYTTECYQVPCRGLALVVHSAMQQAEPKMQ